jgi:hypothetical protein
MQTLADLLVHFVVLNLRIKSKTKQGLQERNTDVERHCTERMLP